MKLKSVWRYMAYQGFCIISDCLPLGLATMWYYVSVLIRCFEPQKKLQKPYNIVNKFKVQVKVTQNVLNWTECSFILQFIVQYFYNGESTEELTWGYDVKYSFGAPNEFANFYNINYKHIFRQVAVRICWRQWFTSWPQIYAFLCTYSNPCLKSNFISDWMEHLITTKLFLLL